MADLFGVANAGMTAERVTYIAPKETGALAPYTTASPLMLPTAQRKILARNGVKVLGTLTLPYTNPSDGEKYASIHSNPPGIATDKPAIVINRVGKGSVIYAAEALEYHEHCGEIFVRLLQLMCPRFTVEAKAPACVEFTLFHQADRKRFVLSAVNFQKELPNVPVEGVRVSVDLGSYAPKRAVQLPDNDELPMTNNGGRSQIGLPTIQTLCMVAIEYS